MTSNSTAPQLHWHTNILEPRHSRASINSDQTLFHCKPSLFECHGRADSRHAPHGLECPPRVNYGPMANARQACAMGAKRRSPSVSRPDAGPPGSRRCRPCGSWLPAVVSPRSAGPATLSAGSPRINRIDERRRWRYAAAVAQEYAPSTAEGRHRWSTTERRYGPEENAQ